MSNPTPLQFYVITPKQHKDFVQTVKDMFIPECGYLFKWGRIKNQRTIKQNSSVHLYCDHLATALNDAGFLIKESFFNKEIELDWNMERVKTRLWKPAQVGLFNKESTTELETGEVSEVYDTLNRFFADNFKIHVPFPDRFNR
jgi:hypothetical protein